MVGPNFFWRTDFHLTFARHWKGSQISNRNKKPFRIARNGVLRPRPVFADSGLKGISTPATLTRVGVGNLESASSQGVAEIHYGTPEIRGAE